MCRITVQHRFKHRLQNNSFHTAQSNLLFNHVCVCVCVHQPLTFLTHVSSVAGQAKAEEGINLVDASASICTRLGLAVVNVCGEGKKQ